MVEREISNLSVGVRFPLPAPYGNEKQLHSFFPKKSTFPRVRATFFTKNRLARKVVTPVTGIEPKYFQIGRLAC